MSIESSERKEVSTIEKRAACAGRRGSAGGPPMSDEDRTENVGNGKDKYVPDRIDAISASGLVEMHDALNDENTVELESLPIEDWAIMLWKMVEKGVIDADLTEASR